MSNLWQTICFKFYKEIYFKLSSLNTLKSYYLKKSLGWNCSGNCVSQSGFRIMSRFVCPSSSANKSACEASRKALTVECDEAWSFVNNKGNKQWIGNAFDAKTKKFSAFILAIVAQNRR